jgi:hypothetical protein
MPIDYSIDDQRKIVLTRAWGTLTDEDLLLHKDRLSRDPAFTSELRQLSDIRAIERLEVTTKGVGAMVAHDSRHPAQRDAHRLALVVPNDEVFGMARMYQLMAGGERPVRVFRSMADAEAWLELDGLEG